MRLTLVSAAWRRYGTTRLALAQWAHLRGVLAARGLEVSVVLVADDENLDLARSHGFDTVEQSNEYLGRKFNDGIERACRAGADYVVPIGSDDWVHPDVFGRLPGLDEIMSGRSMAIVDMERGRMLRCRVNSFYGAVPWIIPRAVLEPSGFRPVDDHIARGLEGSFLGGLRALPTWAPQDTHDLARVDFKSSLNLTPFTAWRHSRYGPETEPWAALAAHYPARLVDLARQTHEELAAAAV